MSISDWKRERIGRQVLPDSKLLVTEDGTAPLYQYSRDRFRAYPAKAHNTLARVNSGGLNYSLAMGWILESDRVPYTHTKTKRPFRFKSLKAAVKVAETSLEKEAQNKKTPFSVSL